MLRSAVHTCTISIHGHLCVVLFIGTVVTLLIDKTVLQDNMYFSGRQNLTTNDVIKRLENYITCVSKDTIVISAHQ